MLLPIVVGAGSSSDAINRLLGNDIDKRLVAEKYLINKDGDAVKALHRYFFPKIDELVRNLGSDTFHVRQEATQALIQVGKPCVPRLTAVLEKSEDPEIRYRCKLCLKAIHAADDTLKTKHMMLALSIILQVASTPEESQDFLLFYFDNFNTLPWSLQDLVPVAAERCRDNGVLRKMLLECRNITRCGSVLSVLEKRMPTQMEEIRKQYIQHHIELTSDISNILKDVKAINGFDPGEAEEIIVRMKDFPFFKQASPAIVKKLLLHPEPRAFELGVLLVKGSPEPHLKYILTRLATFPERENVGWFLAKWKNHRELFAPHIPALITSTNSSIRKLAFEACRIQPEQHVDRMISALKTSYDWSILEVACDILQSQGKETLAQEVLVKRILGSQPSYKVVTLASLLHKRYDYRGRELEDWWLSHIKAMTVEKRSMMSEYIRLLNISPEHVLPYLSELTVNYQIMEYLLSKTVKEEDRDLVINAGQGYFQKYPHATQLLHLLIDLKPGKAHGLISKYLSYLMNNGTLTPLGVDQIDHYAALVCRFPNLAQLFRDYTIRGIGRLRFFAASVLSQASLDLPKCRATLLSIKPDTKDVVFRKAIIRSLLIADVKFDLILARISELTRFGSDGYNETSYFVDYLTPKHAKYRDKITHILREELAKGHHKNIYSISRGLLRIHSKDEAARKALSDLILKGDDVNVAWKSLEWLTYSNLDIKLPMERIESLYVAADPVSLANRALSSSPLNLGRARSVIRNNLLKSLQENHSELNYIIDKLGDASEPLIRDILPYLSHKNPEVRKNVIVALSGGAEYLSQYCATLQVTFLEARQFSFRNRICWLLAKMGSKAADFSSILPAVYAETSSQNRAYFLLAMSQISLEKELRQKYLLELIKLCEASPSEWWATGFLCFSDEFCELRDPILRKLLVLDTPVSYRCVWGLIKTDPIDKDTITVFRKLLEKGYGGYSGKELIYAFSSHLDKTKLFKTELQNVRPALRFSSSYLYIMSALEIQ